LLPFERGPVTWREGGFAVSTDRGRLDREALWRFMSGAYWASGLERERFERALAGSLVFGAYAPEGAFAGFARVISDGATFAYLRDVFVLEPYRGRGHGKLLSRCALEHPDLAGVRPWMLATADAHGLYGGFGFEPVEPGRYMRLAK
jgi:GNAT superfamily N-acetyltransferase